MPGSELSPEHDWAWDELDAWFQDQAEALDRSDDARAFEARASAKARARAGGEPVSKVELRCGVATCDCLWEIHLHRESFAIVSEKGPRLGVRMTIERPGPNGSRRYRCHCGYERVLSTPRLRLQSRAAFKAGRSAIFAVDL